MTFATPPQATPAATLPVFAHTTVLLHEAVDALLGGALNENGSVGVEQLEQLGQPSQPPQHYIDGTFGRGGHSRLLLSRMAAQAKLTAFDQDLEAVAVGQALAGQDVRFRMVHTDFAQGLQNLSPASVDGILLDLGISSPQIDDLSRGFSFRGNAPLDMRMDTTQGLTAAQWLAVAAASEIAEVLRDYGEERMAGRIAAGIVAAREAGTPVQTTQDLAGLVARFVKVQHGKGGAGQHPATRTFQAVRIHTNRELAQLEQALRAALAALKPGGRLAVIAFHSLEDRMVKQFLAQHASTPYDRSNPFAALTVAPEPCVQLLGKTKPSDAEITANPRSRSAVMRVAQRTAAPWVAATKAEGGSRKTVASKNGHESKTGLSSKGGHTSKGGHAQGARP